MTPLLFGDSASPLFGVWTPAASASPRRDHGVILCPPIAQEHVRTYWALRQISVALSRAGFDCLRFDWFGVGDSSGDLREASLDRWRADLAAAAQELRDSTGVRTISIVGLRMGGAIAALSAKSIRPKTIVLWDPIVDGKSYVATLRKLTKSATTDHIRYWNPSSNKSVAENELVGFDFGPTLIQELEQLEVDVNALPPNTILRVLTSSQDDTVDAFIERARAKHPGMATHKTEVGACWAEHGNVEELLLPGDAVPSITRLLLGSPITEGARP